MTHSGAYRNFWKIFSHPEWNRYCSAAVALGLGGAALSQSEQVKNQCCNLERLLARQVKIGKLHAETLRGVSIMDLDSKDQSIKLKKGRAPKIVHQRFEQFASLRYTNGEYLMTPMDFLESVTQSQPRPRIGRRLVSQSDLDVILANTPKSSYSSSEFFRRLDYQGVITFPEFCFLIACLNKTRSHIEIAYKIFDRDNSSKIEKAEFQQFADSLTMAGRRSCRLDKGAKEEKRKLRMMKESQQMYSQSEGEPGKRRGEYDVLWSTKLWLWIEGMKPTFNSRTPVVKVTPNKKTASEANAVTEKMQSVDVLGDEAEQEAVPRTTLTQYFFGKKGTGKLPYDHFLNFIRNLQTEILQVEFTEYSKGLKTISEDEFAKILLRHTNMSAEDQERMLDNLVCKGSSSFTGITFEQFSEFFYFLNNIEDFTVAVNIYSYAGHNLDKEAFQRAYKITTHGKEIPPNILDTIFLLFDVDNDGELSKKEFIGQMKDAVQRGFRYHQLEYVGWSGFRTCIAHEMKKQSSSIKQT